MNGRTRCRLMFWYQPVAATRRRRLADYCHHPRFFFNIFSSQKIQNCQVFLFDRHENIFCLMIKNRLTNNFNLFLLKKYTNNVLLRMRSTVCSLPILASHLRIIFKYCVHKYLYFSIYSYGSCSQEFKGYEDTTLCYNGTYIRTFT